MNRTIAPDTLQINHIQLPKLEVFKLDNGLTVYGLPSEHEVMKLDFVFDAGKWFEEQNLVADFANRLAREGTKGKSSLQINELLDFYGASLENQSFFSNAGFQLYSLSKNVPKLLPLMHELLTEADFPAHEVDIFKENRKAKHLQRLAKTDYVANRIFLQNMWGNVHPYGRVTEVEDIEKIEREALKKFFEQHYHAGNSFIILAGKYNEAILQQLNLFFGNKNWVKENVSVPTFTYNASPNLEHFIEKEKSVQCSLMVGKQEISKDDPEFDEMTVVNTLLGGYFGSRLMANIREQKGYTYGIYSAISAYKHGAIFEISTDIGKEYRNATLDEIQKEFSLLKNEPVDKEELQTVKNYMSGKILRSADGAFRFSDVLKGLILFDRTPESLNEYLGTIQQISPERIMELSKKHFDFENMYRVAVG